MLLLLFQLLHPVNDFYANWRFFQFSAYTYIMTTKQKQKPKSTQHNILYISARFNQAMND